ncbi:hypothetical protein [Myroides odoratus]|jgi:hypothetical protein|uniref:Uncharacterized protein n=1 Tax=Myroides odoratus TaxID=256 RepID=A0A9Q7E7X2_MYROD|nr:hypothetical protein [Myroides odoratus]EHQ41633.1 hypothetical protein Myrod_0797 [Myroides odoratus DSM 2801]EKB08877.1 hypothetical protein HMPREF9716_00647 [Myroides odoratus CIP 103059]QQT99042.1 hypothetical protein I6I88_12570 [Myroides odoratus]WQD58766.1 hypothetical protein U0010_06395 [Myroides odoratus]STZ28892.1 Uncharacterised protein [Myroides odoratus]
MLSFNNETKQLIIQDNYKGRLTSSRLMSAVILAMSLVRLFMANWESPKEMDYVFCIIAAVFLFLVYKNFLTKTAAEQIDKVAIKYVKMPKGLATKAVVKLNNGKVREIFNLKTKDQQGALRKILTNAKITMK